MYFKHEVLLNIAQSQISLQTIFNVLKYQCFSVTISFNNKWLEKYRAGKEREERHIQPLLTAY